MTLSGTRCNMILPYNSNDDGWTPIHLAAKNGHFEALELLVEHAERRHIDIIDEHHVSLAVENTHRMIMYYHYSGLLYILPVLREDQSVCTYL